MRTIDYILQKTGLFFAYTVLFFALIPALIYFPYLFKWEEMSGAWGSYLTEMGYYFSLILFTWLCIIRWLKRDELSTVAMLLSALVTSIVVYALLALTCKWEPAFLRHSGMDLYVPWWLEGHRQFFIGLTPETTPSFYRINIMDNGVFQSTLLGFPGLLVWAICCTIDHYYLKRSNSMSI